ncbi:myb/SANT-like DNA-binding domain-containing protein 4 [Mytilus edulis]|uniref:myb/SANT-like DNA-binding domain-containing protein 4 n=1 Tax=Mytilus edulis TaxID=6550 RepID=UPI0039F11541
MSKRRNPNFTDAELQTLLDEIEKDKTLLFSKLSNVATNGAKKRAWDTICSKVNATNTDHKRTVDEIRKKWSTNTSIAKKQASRIRRESRKTGGGPPPEELTPLQDKVVAIIGNTPIDGIDGGIDTCPGMEFDGVPAEEPTQTRDSDSSNENETGKYSEPTPEDCKLVEIEGERLKVEKERLHVEKQRLHIEQLRLEIDQQRLVTEQQKHQLYMAKLNISMTQMGVHVADTPSTSVEKDNPSS